MKRRPSVCITADMPKFMSQLINRAFDLLLKKWPAVVTIEILEPQTVKQLAEELGLDTSDMSEFMPQLIDYALDVLSWAFKKRREGYQIGAYKISEGTVEIVERLKLELPLKDPA